MSANDPNLPTPLTSEQKTTALIDSEAKVADLTEALVKLGTKHGDLLAQHARRTETKKPHRKHEYLFTLTVTASTAAACMLGLWIFPDRPADVLFALIGTLITAIFTVVMELGFLRPAEPGRYAIGMAAFVFISSGFTFAIMKRSEVDAIEQAMQIASLTDGQRRQLVASSEASRSTRDQMTQVSDAIARAVSDGLNELRSKLKKDGKLVRDDLMAAIKVSETATEERIASLKQSAAEENRNVAARFASLDSALKTQASVNLDGISKIGSVLATETSKSNERFAHISEALRDSNRDTAQTRERVAQALEAIVQAQKEAAMARKDNRALVEQLTALALVVDKLKAERDTPRPSGGGGADLPGTTAPAAAH